MAEDIRFVWDRSGYDELRNSPGVVADISRRARAIAERAEGMGVRCEITSKAYPRKATATVWCADEESERANAKSNALLKSRDAGRG